VTERPANQDEPTTGDTAQNEPTAQAEHAQAEHAQAEHAESAARAGTPARAESTARADAPAQAGAPMAQGGAAAQAAGPVADSGRNTDSELARSAELVVRRVAAPVARARRWPDAVAGLGRRLPQVLRHPATVASASVAATVATRLLVSGLRQAARHAAATSGGAGGTGRASAGGPIAVAGYVLHEVHVIHHHVVHYHTVPHTVRPPLP
jgi:hypothetical protein